MLIKNPLYISGVFIKISKMCSKMAYNNNKNKRFKQHIHLNFSLKEHFFECFISFKICYAFEFYISTLKQKKQKKTVHRLLYHHQNYCERESSLHHFICETSDIHGDRRDCVRIKLLFSKK